MKLALGALGLTAMVACGGGSGDDAGDDDAGPVLPYLCGDWGEGGVYDNSFGTNGGSARAVMVLPDGSLIAVGHTTDGGITADTAIVRVDAAGRPASDFGDGGAVVVAQAPSTDMYLTLVARGPGFVVGGGAYDLAPGDDNSDLDALAVAFDDHGAVDPGFCGGRLVHDGGAAASEAVDAIAVVDDLTYVAVNIESTIELRRYTAGCALDPTYGDAGVVVAGVYNGSARFRSDGAAYVLGSDGGTSVLAAFAPDGSPDPSFGGGRVALALASATTGILVLGDGGDGRLLAGTMRTLGINQYETTIARVIASGALDPGFGSGGYAVTTSPGWLTALAAQPDGAVLIGGQIPSSILAAVARLDAAGQLDTSFGDGGVVTVGGQYSAVEDVVVMPDGRILAAGETANAMRLACIEP